MRKQSFRVSQRQKLEKRDQREEGKKPTTKFIHFTTLTSTWMVPRRAVYREMVYLHTSRNSCPLDVLIFAALILGSVKVVPRRENGNSTSMEKGACGARGRKKLRGHTLTI